MYMITVGPPYIQAYYLGFYILVFPTFRYSKPSVGSKHLCFLVQVGGRELGIPGLGFRGARI